MDKQEVLAKYFGHESFRQGQAEVIDSIMSGRDCLAVMPTGAGKSMCYQIPAMLSFGTTIVVSPLISLMKDQVESLVQSGINAAYINSSLSQRDYFTTIDRAARGDFKIIYVSPERLLNEHFLSLCREISVPLVAVDEAHCVSHWGQDFRPSYLKIPDFIEKLEKRPVVAAFTATATDIVKRDILKILGLRQPFAVTTGFDRANLYFEVRRFSSKELKNAELVSIIRELSGRSGIVYCSTRKNVEEVCDLLCENGINAQAYHAGLDDLQRKQAQEDFIFDRCGVIVATNAFGMGIDKSNVSLVVHYNMPKDLESYYQEAGRAGRDGSPARCILLYSKADVRTADFLIEHSREDSSLSPKEQQELIKRDKERLKQMTFYSTTPRCLRNFILKYFGESCGSDCGRCGNCDEGFEALDITVEAQKIISCIFRLKQRQKAADKRLLCGILRGGSDVEIISGGLDTLSTYGIMREYSDSYIVEIIDYLAKIGLISGNSALEITPAGEEFISRRRTLLMKRRKTEKPEGIITPSVPQESDGDSELMKLLKAFRKKQADILGVPAYVVFSDAALNDMCEKLPQTPEEFLRVSGVGSIKAERYGRDFMKIIAEYLNKR